MTEIKTEPQEELQDVKINSLKDFLNFKFETVGKDIARLDGKYTEFERKNCSKHTIIQDLLSRSMGEMNARMEELKDRMFTKDQYDMFLISNNGKLRMIDDRISKADDRVAKSEKRIEKVWQYLTIAGVILVGIWEFGKTLILEFLKRKI